jgi:hypothetical protein
VLRRHAARILCLQAEGADYIALELAACNGVAAMGTSRLMDEVPDELLALLGSREAAAARAREALVMELLRDATISQGKAAALLGIDRGELLELSARYRVPAGPRTAEEWQREMTVVERLVQERGRAADRQ